MYLMDFNAFNGSNECSRTLFVLLHLSYVVNNKSQCGPMFGTEHTAMVYVQILSLSVLYAGS